MTPAQGNTTAAANPYPAGGAQASEGAERGGRATVAALQAALSAEHAAVYGYGVVGGRVAPSRKAEARAAWDAHRARRDSLQRAVRDLGGSPRPSAAGYELPFAVKDPKAAVELAAELEDRVAAVYSDLVRASSGDARRDAARALREAAVRATRWRGGSVAFPGLTERPARHVADEAPAGAKPQG